MISLSKTHLNLYHRRLSFTHRHSSFPKPSFFPSHSFSSSPPLLLTTIKASSSPNNNNKPQNPFSQILKTLNPFTSPLLEPAYIAVALLALFLFRFQQNPATARSSLPPRPPPPAQSSNTTIDDKLIQNSNDANALMSLVEENVKARKLSEAIRVVERLVELEPEEFDLLLLKSQLHSHNGEHELAKKGFESTLQQDPFNSDAYRGLMLANSELKEPMEGFLNRIDEAVKFFEENKMESEAREFKLLIAHVKVMEEDYSGALKLYEEIVKEEPSDCRPYLCQGFVYSLLEKDDEARKQFEEFRRLVPENHPYREYYEDNVKLLSK